MTFAPRVAGAVTSTTDGEIAIINLESIRRRSWARFANDPTRDGVAETVIEHEQLTLQFAGDVFALDRVELLSAQLAKAEPASARVALIQAQIASMGHRFSDARHHLTQAEICGAPAADVERLCLSIDQACGTDLDNVLDARRRIASENRGLQDSVVLASLLADLRDFTAADETYKEALRAYRDVSPFPVAGVCFQLGMLWGELVPDIDPSTAAQWYSRAIAVLPRYTKARVHLAEICSEEGRLTEAEALLLPVAAVGDPEVDWRLADVLAAQGRFEESEVRLRAACSGFESLLERHLLAFADHGAEFYAGSGNDARRALHLARVNVSNRPTLRALERAYDIATADDDASVALELLSEATNRWGHTSAFALSSLQQHPFSNRTGAAA